MVQMMSQRPSLSNIHWHNKVTRTQQTIRLVRGRLIFGAEIDSPPNSPDREDLTQPARDYTRNIDDLRAEVRSPPNSPDREDLTQPARVYTRDNDDLRAEIGSPLNSPDREDLTQPERVYTRNIDDLRAEVGSPPNSPDRNYLTQPARVAVNDTRNTHDLHEDTLQEAQHDNLEPARVAAHLTTGTSPARTIHERRQYENTRVRDNQKQELPQAATVADHLIHATNNGDDIRGERPARRHSEIHTMSFDTSSDVVIIERTPRRRPPTRAYPTFRVETDNDNRAKQFGIPVDEVDADVTKWHLSRTSIMGAGPPSRRGVGVVAPSFMGKQTYLAMERQYRFWFCPNGVCHRRPGANACRTQMPRVLEIFPVQRETNLTQEEVDFLTEKGFLLVHADRPAETAHSYPTEPQIKVMVDAYPEKVMERPEDFRFKTRGGKGCRQKSTPSRSCLIRLEHARSASICVLHSWNVSTGNGYGILFRVASVEIKQLTSVMEFPDNCAYGTDKRGELDSKIRCLEERILILLNEKRDVNEKLQSYMSMLNQWNAQYAAALRDIIILTIEMEESRMSHKHATEELRLFKEDFNKRTSILEGVVNDHEILDTHLLQRFRSLVLQSGKPS
ncbi:hypothetical protein R1sor_026402 [Riccia sorocarpa]|uniref:Uncharacterized protein n=1 Tax=Riccia sorocarpa TaxID=122646 RepID=A0ABD3GDD0_9MARC